MFLSGHADDAGVIVVGGNVNADQGLVARWENNVLCVEADAAADGTLWWADGTATGWVAVGTHGVVLREADGVRSRDDIDTTATLFGVWMEGDTTWAVGGDVGAIRGEIWRQPAGEPWELVLGDLEALLFKAWNGWFIGDGVAWYWNGTELEERHPPDGVRLLTMHGVSADDTWAVGGRTNAVILRYTDGAWSQPTMDPRCLHAPLSGVWVDADGVPWVAGHNGIAASWQDDAWVCDSPPITAEHFHGVIGAGEQVLWMGGNLLSATDNYGTLATWPSSAGPNEVHLCE
jgi:hypothetical protein